MYVFTVGRRNIFRLHDIASNNHIKAEPWIIKIIISLIIRL